MSEKKGELGKILTAGIFKENPIFIMFLGLCPVLGVTTTLENSIGLGGSLAVVLILSNFVISLIRKIVPGEVRIPVYIVIIASITTVIMMFMNAYMPDLYDSLGVFLPLVAVNCIILGRAESFASKNNAGRSILDAVGSGIGFFIGICLVGFTREFLGTGGIFGVQIFPSEFAIGVFTTPPGSFLVLGLLAAIITAISTSSKAKKEAKAKLAAAENVKGEVA